MKESGGLKKLVSLITDQPLPEEESKKVDKKAGSRMGKKSASKDGVSYVFLLHANILM